MADKQVTNLRIQLQNGTDRTVYATWNFDSTANKKLDHYDVRWMYRVKGNDIWFKEGDSTEQYKQSLYTPPSNATKVKLKVKPVAKEVQSGSKSSPAWTGSWVTSDVFTIPEKEVIDSDGPGDEDVPTPPTPVINIDSNSDLIAAVENYKVEGARVCIDVWKNDGKDGASNIQTEPWTDVNDPNTWVGLGGYRATVGCKAITGAYYKARACAIVNGKVSKWSDFCSNVDAMSPSVPSAPTVDIDEDGLLTASLDNYEHQTARICFEIVENDVTTVNIRWVDQVNRHAELTYQTTMGRRYKARCMVEFEGVPTQWSDFSSNVEPDGPPVPSVPSCSIESGVFTASIENYKYDQAEIFIQIVENDSKVVKGEWIVNRYGRVVSTYNVKQDGRYKARAMARYRGITTRWSDYSSNIATVKPDIPPVPEISIDGYTVTAVVDNYVLDGGKVYFQFVENDARVVGGGWVNIHLNRAVLTYKASAGSKYKVRVKAQIGQLVSDWSDFTENVEVETPAVPPVPDVTITDFTLTATIDNYVVTQGTTVYIQIIENDTTIFGGAWLTPVLNRVTLSKTVGVGNKYKARARAKFDILQSEWSDFSANVETKPDTVKSITSIKALSSTSVQLEWTAATGATDYEVQYADDKDFFDASSSTSSDSMAATLTRRIIQNLETGKEWFFRVRATNSVGQGGWSNIASVVIGTKPDVPTTWSYNTVVSVGEPAILNWTHNCEDGSEQRAAEIEVTIGDGDPTVYSVTTDQTYTIETTGVADSTPIYWRVRTKGAIEEWGDWSVERAVMVYNPPSIVMTLTPGATVETTEDPNSFEKYPIKVSLKAQPTSQEALTFFFSIVSNDTYETTADNGMTRYVAAGETVYSTVIANPGSNTANLKLTPGEVDLESGTHYTAYATVAMSSGLSADESYDFYTAFGKDTYNPDAEVIVDRDLLVAHIRPFCLNQYGTRITSGAKLAVYRRNYDGTFTEIASNLSMNSFAAVTDPHPSLDYARYRITAESNTTGQISFYDLPGYPILESSIILQWDEEWTYFNYNEDDDTVEPAWSGSFLKLPYNIDISDSNDMDVSLVEYIGRENPVTYYGTQKGFKSSWRCDIKKEDNETLYALRRLARYAGDVYVREPSGTGYWAYVKVSYELTHNQETIPVTFDVTRVEGGM